MTITKAFWRARRPENHREYCLPAWRIVRRSRTRFSEARWPKDALIAQDLARWLVLMRMRMFRARWGVETDVLRDSSHQNMHMLHVCSCIYTATF